MLMQLYVTILIIKLFINMRTKTLNRNPKNRINELKSFRKECIEKGISLKDVIKERRLKRLTQDNK